MLGGLRSRSGVHLSVVLTQGWWGLSFLCWSLRWWGAGWWWHPDVDRMLGGTCFLDEFWPSGKGGGGPRSYVLT